MAKTKKQVHKTGSKLDEGLTPEQIRADYEKRATEFKTRFEALQLEMKIAVVATPQVNQNGTLGAYNSLIDLKTLKTEEDHAGGNQQ